MHLRAGPVVRMRAGAPWSPRWRCSPRAAGHGARVRGAHPDRRVDSTAGAVVLFVRRGTGTATSGLGYLVPRVTALPAVPVLGQSLDRLTVVGLVTSGEWCWCSVSHSRR